MSKNRSLALEFVIAVLGMAGISYWVVQERSQSTALTKNVAEAPAPAMQRPAQNSPPAGEQSPSSGSTTAGEVPAPGTENSPPAHEERPLDNSTAASPTETPNLQAGPTTGSASTTAAGQSTEPTTPSPTVSSPPTGASQPTQGTAPAPPSSTALAVAMPAEDKMTLENRRAAQKALQRLGYYEGPLDGIFGPATRSAIRRFQESIGAEATGRLNETEASRLITGT
jgi:hypothetical protein